jgi:hypothetical protein
MSKPFICELWDLPPNRLGKEDAALLVELTILGGRTQRRVGSDARAAEIATLSGDALPLIELARKV